MHFYRRAFGLSGRSFGAFGRCNARSRRRVSAQDSYAALDASAISLKASPDISKDFSLAA